MTSIVAKPGTCPKCGSNLLSINEDGDYDCLCGCVVYTRPITQVKSKHIVASAKATSVTEIPREEPKANVARKLDDAFRGETYFDQHRDEILADRFSIGNAKTMVKWSLSHPVWTELKRKWKKQGIVVEDLRHASRRLANEEAEEKVARGQKKDTSPEELEQYEPGVTREEFFAVLKKVTEPIKDVDKGQVSRKDVVPDVEKPSKVRLVFRWLVSEGIEPSYEMADELLAKYLKKDAIETTKELVGDRAFDITDLRKGMFRVYLEELLESMPEFKETREGVYHYDKDGGSAESDIEPGEEFEGSE